MNQKNGNVMPTSVGSPLLPLTIKPAGPVGRKPIVRTDAKLWNHSVLESRIELHSMIIWSFIRPPCRSRRCAKVR
jgi:hypothetical protein